MMRNRSPARGWKRYRMMTSGRGVWWVVCRTFVQNTETEPQNQNLRWHFRKRPADSDLDRVNRHAAAAMASLPIQTELVLFQSRIPIAHDPVHLSRPKRMARRSPRHPASRTSTTSAGLVLIGTADVTQLVTSFSKPHF